MFSGLETQSEISRLLEELYGSLDRTPPEEAEDACTILFGIFGERGEENDIRFMPEAELVH